MARSDEVNSYGYLNRAQTAHNSNNIRLRNNVGINRFQERERQLNDAHFQLPGLQRTTQATPPVPVGAFHNLSNGGNVVSPISRPSPNHLPLRNLHSSSSIESVGSTSALQNNNVGAVGTLGYGVSRLVPSGGYGTINAHPQSNNIYPMLMLEEEQVRDHQGTSARNLIVPDVFASERAFMEFANKHDPWLHPEAEIIPGWKFNVEEEMIILDDDDIATTDASENGASSNMLQTQESGIHAISQPHREEVEVESPIKKDHHLSTAQQTQMVQVLSQNHVTSRPQHSRVMNFTGASLQMPTPTPTPTPILAPTPSSLLVRNSFSHSLISGIKCIFCFREMPLPLEQKWCGHFYHQTCLSMARDHTPILQCTRCRLHLREKSVKRCRFCLGELPMTTDVKPCGHYFHFMCLMQAGSPTFVADCEFCSA